MPLSIENAGAYVTALKAFLAPTMTGMIETPNEWDPAANNWYGMLWQGAGSPGADGKTDPTSGQESILGAFSGQIIRQATFAGSGLTVDMQNHTVIYYDALSATMLNKLWANPFAPNRKAVSFPGRGDGGQGRRRDADAGTMAGAGRLCRSGTSTGPPVPQLTGPADNPNLPRGPEVLPLRVLQFDIIVKDSVASPQTGWVFVTYVYDKDAAGDTTWDRLVPLGAMWGNDPAFASNPNGTDPSGGPLQETWINPAAPAYAKSSLGWGGRLSGPIDVAERHNVLLDRRHACAGDGDVVVPELPRHGAVSVHLQSLSVAEQDIPARGHDVPDVCAGLADVDALVPEQAGFAAAEQRHRIVRSRLRHADHVRAQRLRCCGRQRRVRARPCRRPLSPRPTGSTSWSAATRRT